MSADLTKLKVVKQLDRKDILFGLARRPNSDEVFVGSSDFNVYDVDLAAEKPEPTPLEKHGSYVTGVCLVGDTVVSGGYDCRLSWWDVKKKKSLHNIEAHAKRIRAVVASPDGKLVASVADDMLCKLWDAKTGKLVRELAGHEPLTPSHFPSMLYAACFSADGKLLATGDKVGRVCIWNIADGKQLGTVEAPGMYTWDPVARRHSIGGIRSLAFSPDGEILCVGGTGQIKNIDHLEVSGRLEVFDWAAGKRRCALDLDGKYKGLVEQLRFLPDGERLVGVGGAAAGFIAFYDVVAGKILFQDSAPMHVHGLAVSEDGGKLYAAGHNKLVVWSL